MAFYSSTYPFTDYWTNKELRSYAKRKGIPCSINHISTQEQGHSMPIPWIINSVFYNGELATFEMDSPNRLDAVIYGKKA